MKTGEQTIRQRYWASRASGERRIIIVLAIVLLPLLAYVVLWKPAHSALTWLHRTVPELRVQAVTLREQAAEVTRISHVSRPAVLDGGALKQVVEASAAQHQLSGAITTLNVQGSNSVRISLDAISFAEWLQWLRDLQEEQHVRVDSAGIAALAQLGMVRVSATLTNGSVQ